MKLTLNKKIFVLFFLLGFISICIYGGVKYVEKKERDRKIEARFDKFASYWYPYLEGLAEASNIYSRMQISLIYDYIETQRGRYINETVNYFDGGSFSMRQEFDLFLFLKKNYDILFISRSLNPIDYAPKSRLKERFDCLTVLYTAKDLLDVDIYGEYIELEDIHKKIDSLNCEIQSSFHNLYKYKKSSIKVNLNSIPEADYHIENY